MDVTQFPTFGNTVNHLLTGHSSFFLMNRSQILVILILVAMSFRVSWAYFPHCTPNQWVNPVYLPLNTYGVSTLLLCCLSKRFHQVKMFQDQESGCLGLNRGFDAYELVTLHSYLNFQSFWSSAQMRAIVEPISRVAIKVE